MKVRVEKAIELFGDKYLVPISLVVRKKLKLTETDIIKISSNKTILLCRVLYGLKAESKEPIIHLNPLLRRKLNVNIGDSVNICNAGCFEKIKFFLFQEHLNELIVGIVTSLVTGIIFLILELFLSQ